MTYDLRAALAATDLFGHLPARTLRRLAAGTQVVTHAAGQPIASEGRLGVGLHLILEGTASVRVGKAKRPDLGPGQYFGEISMIDRQPRSAQVTAKTDLVTASITSWAFRPILKEDPALAMALLLTMCARLRSVEGAESRKAGA